MAATIAGVILTSRRPGDALRRRTTSRRAQPPADGRDGPGRKWVALQAATLALAAFATVLSFLARDVRPPAPADAGGRVGSLPRTPDYHTLLVASDDANRILLGTHDGVFESVDGGRTWRGTSLVDVDAMSLERTGGSTLWAAGHGLLAVSTDGGRTWGSLRPKGLPSLDVHALAVDADRPRTVYAAVMDEGLYRSTDGGRTFRLASREVGGDVIALTLTMRGELVASDAERGLVVSSDGGRTWKTLRPTPFLGLAAHPDEPQTVLAGGRGVLVSRNRGRSFRKVLEIIEGAGPVAWAPKNGAVGYAVGLNRTLYRSLDGGNTWRPVS